MPKKPTREQMIAYIQVLEAGNKKLVITLKRCLELLARSTEWGTFVQNVHKKVSEY